MGGGRKNLKRGVKEHNLTLEQGQSIVQVVSLRGSNLIEVMDANGEKSLAFFPRKFQRSMWIKTGNFVVVDDSGKEEALESGSKVASIVSQVLFHDQVKHQQKNSYWPEAFKTQTIESSNRKSPGPASEQEAEETGSSDDDGLPPLETNMNRRRPYELHSGSASDSDANSDIDE